MKKNKHRANFFEKRPVTISFAAIALLFGFFFLDSGITGNAVLNKQIPVNLVSIAGLLLILCSVILVAYSLKKS
jgi:hypothetical protein